MKRWLAFIIICAFAVGLWGCSQKEPVAFGHAIVCPDCGGYRSEDTEFCAICERNENIKEWFEYEPNDENISIQIDN